MGSDPCGAKADCRFLGKMYKPRQKTTILPAAQWHILDAWLRIVPPTFLLGLAVGDIAIKMKEGMVLDTRRGFLAASVGALSSVSGLAMADATAGRTRESVQVAEATTSTAKALDHAEDPRIVRARASGPDNVTRDATIAEMAPDGSITVIHKGTNEWVCVPGDLDRVGEPPMCMNPMGMQWMMDALQGKPKPTINAPGIIYMLCGATQHSNTNPRDRTSPAIPVGPHWMIMWPFDADAIGVSTAMRDDGAWVMFAGTPWAYLHICGSPWQGREYQGDEKASWTMTYSHLGR